MTIVRLWEKHYVSGITGSYHGDMASAFNAMLADAECDAVARRMILAAVDLHCRLERTTGLRKYFCELFGTRKERQEALDIAGSVQ